MKKNITLFLMMFVLCMFSMSMNAQAPQSGTYRIQNAGSGLYVAVTGSYSAEPNVDQTNASYIHVGIGDLLSDGSYKVTSLGSQGIEVYNYVAKAVLLAKGYVQTVLTDKGQYSLSSTEVAEADKLIDTYAQEYAYMSVKPVGDGYYYAIAAIPSIPDSIETLAAKHGVTDGVWSWAKRKVKEYFEKRGTNSALVTKILANIDKVEPGKTYYLAADAQQTFDYYEASKVSAAGKLVEWKLEAISDDVVKTAFYNIKNVGNGKYVKVTGKYAAEPDAAKADASDIYVGVAGRLTDGSYKLNSLSSTVDGNTIDVYDYVGKAVAMIKAKALEVLSNSSEANQDKALDYIDSFVYGNAYMRVMPTGKGYVYALATVPAIPAVVAEEAAKKGIPDLWAWGKEQVKSYLAASNTNASLKAKILKYLDVVKLGHTYYLAADSYPSFDYVDADSFSITNDNIKWNLEEVAKVAPNSAFYNIHNVGNGKYVKVKGKYSADPDADKANASNIYVGVGDICKDGSYKVTSLASKGIEVYDYVGKAVAIAQAKALEIIKNSSDSNKEKALEYIKNFITDNAYMRVLPVKDATYVYALATIPAIPEEVAVEAAKKGIADLWTWGKDQVKAYLAKSSTDTYIKSVILKHIDEVKQGHTYYLAADKSNTFDYADADTVKLTNDYFKWGLEKANVVVGDSGYYRIKNAAGVSGKRYVVVTGRYSAEPNGTEESVVTKPGSVIYVSQGAMTTDAYKLTSLRSQGVEVLDYIAKAATLAQQYAKTMIDEKLTGTSYELYKALAEALAAQMIDNYAKTYGCIYVAPVFTSKNEPAYRAKATVPALKDINELAKELFGLGKGQGIAAQHPKFFVWSGGKAVELDTVYVFNYAKQMLVGIMKQRGVSQTLQDLVSNNLNRINSGHTYYLTEDSEASFDFANLDEVTALGDAGKWILEPVKNDGKYFGVAPDENISYQSPDKKTYYYTTLYTDYAYTLPETVKAFKVPSAAKEKVGASKYAYPMANLTEITTGYVPAQTPVVLQCESTDAADNKLEPFKAVAKKQSPYKVTAGTKDDNILVGTFFDEATADGSNYRQLANSVGTHNTETYVVSGVGFWDVVSKLVGNNAYLDATLANSNEEGYLLHINESDVITGVEDNVASKAVESVKYYNVAGIESAAPFEGVNIVVTTYTDGSKTTVKKIVK
jgi:hypothetical protein